MRPEIEIVSRQGWGIPNQSRKAHYFVDSMSLCRKWGFFLGHVEDDNHESADNCAECKRLYRRDAAILVARAAKESA